MFRRRIIAPSVDLLSHIINGSCLGIGRHPSAPDAMRKPKSFQIKLALTRTYSPCYDHLLATTMRYSNKAFADLLKNCTIDAAPRVAAQESPPCAAYRREEHASLGGFRLA